MKALAALASCLAVLLAVCPPASARTVWLCKPGLAENPCLASLTTTVIGADGQEHARRVRRARRPKIDCFYVYPTVSGQPTVNANREIEAEQRAVARQQASRFSQVCRPFAPVYRQLTIAGIGRPEGIPSAGARLAYRDVRDAWREYLRRHNRGRGVVLIGHTQGTYMLRELVKREIDRRPRVRVRLVSALLIGGNVLVRKGRRAGATSGTSLPVGAHARLGASSPTRPSATSRPRTPASAASSPASRAPRAIRPGTRSSAPTPPRSEEAPARCERSSAPGPSPACSAR